MDISKADRIEDGVYLTTYECHKKVRADKIIDLIKDPIGGAQLVLDATTVKVNKEYMDRNPVEIGGYYVLYKDGYESFSPSEAFEEGYTQVLESYPETEPQPAIKLKVGTFEWAMFMMKGGSKVYRKGWGNTPDKNIVVYIKTPNASSTENYLQHIVMEKTFMVEGREQKVIFPLDLSAEAVMANDWDMANDWEVV